MAQRCADDRLRTGAVVNITYPRFTLASGKKFVIIGQDADFDRNVLTLTVWG